MLLYLRGNIHIYPICHAKRFWLKPPTHPENDRCDQIFVFVVKHPT